MPNISGSNESYRQQSQYMNIRGAQISEQHSNNKKEGQRKGYKTTSKKQLIGTIIGIAIVVLILILLEIIGFL